MDKTILEILDKILDEGAAKISDGRYKFSKIDDLYFIQENQGRAKFETILEFEDLVIALSKYSELVTE